MVQGGFSMSVVSLLLVLVIVVAAILLVVAIVFGRGKRREQRGFPVEPADRNEPRR